MRFYLCVPGEILHGPWGGIGCRTWEPEFELVRLSGRPPVWPDLGGSNHVVYSCPLRLLSLRLRKNGSLHIPYRHGTPNLPKRYAFDFAAQEINRLLAWLPVDKSPRALHHFRNEFYRSDIELAFARSREIQQIDADWIVDHGFNRILHVAGGPCVIDATLVLKAAQELGCEVEVHRRRRRPRRGYVRMSREFTHSLNPCRRVQRHFELDDRGRSIPIENVDDIFQIARIVGPRPAAKPRRRAWNHVKVDPSRARISLLAD